MSEADTQATQTQELVPKLTPEQYDLLLFAEQYYWRHGGLPSYQVIVREGIDFDESVYHEAWTNPRFLDGLRGRGIPEHLITPERGALRGKVLTEQQFTVANVMLDILDKRSRLKKLTELGVSTSEYNGWLRDPVYRQYCLERSEELLTSNQHVAHMSLIERVAQGDLGAIKYFNSMTGRFREKSAAGVEVNVAVNGGSDMLIRIVEIIQSHVKDPATLEAIATDILALTGSTAPGSTDGVGAHQSEAAARRLPAVGPLGFRTGENIIAGRVATYGV